MELNFPAPRVFFDAIRVSWFKRMTAEIDAFADALEAWLYGLRGHPPGQWRERLDQFVAEQEAEGRLLSPEGREQIIAYLDNWAASLRQVDETPPARFVKTSTNWPALSEEDRQRTYGDYGLPGWYGKPLDWGDAEWEAVFEKLGRESRDRMLEVCQQLTALGRLAKDADNLADDGLEELTSHKQQVQAAYDAYILSLVEIQRQWLDYINRHWFVGLQIQKLIARLEADLPSRLFDLASSHSKALATVANDVNKALGRVTDRLDTAYKTAIWSDRVILAIEVVSAIGAIKAGAFKVLEAAIEKGVAKAVAVRMAAKYVVKELAIQASTYVIAGYALPPLLAASGVNQDFVFTGLMVMQGLTTLHAVRAAKVAGGPAKTGKAPTPDVDSPPIPQRGAAPNKPSSSIGGPATIDNGSKAITSSRFFRRPAFWNQIIEFRGLKVYQRNDLIDPNLVDLQGRTNLQRMKKGLAPIGKDNESIEIHHLLQVDDGPVAEVEYTFHLKNREVLHINPSTIPSGIERGDWNNWRRAYWRKRAKDFVGGSQ